MYNESQLVTAKGSAGVPVGPRGARPPHGF